MASTAAHSAAAAEQGGRGKRPIGGTCLVLGCVNAYGLVLHIVRLI